MDVVAAEVGCQSDFLYRHSRNVPRFVFIRNPNLVRFGKPGRPPVVEVRTGVAIDRDLDRSPVVWVRSAHTRHKVRRGCEHGKFTIAVLDQNKSFREMPRFLRVLTYVMNGIEPAAKRRAGGDLRGGRVKTNAVLGIRRVGKDRLGSVHLQGVPFARETDFKRHAAEEEPIARHGDVRRVKLNREGKTAKRARSPSDVPNAQINSIDCT